MSALLMLLLAYVLQPFALKAPNVGVVDASRILKRGRVADITKAPSVPLPPSPSGRNWAALFAPPTPEAPAAAKTVQQRLKGLFRKAN